MELVAKTHRVGVGRANPNSDWSWRGVVECDCGMFTVVYYLYNLLQLFIFAICLQIGNIWNATFFFFYVYQLLPLFIYAICLQIGNVWTAAFF